MQIITLKKDAERRIKAGHLWIFSNDIDTVQSPLKNYQSGELIKIQASYGKPIAIGYINPHCVLCIRVLTTDCKSTIDTAFFIARFERAKNKRDFYDFKSFARMVFGESDSLPGIVIDQYGDVLVMQINTAGMENLKAMLIDAAKHVFKSACIVLKCDSSEREIEGLNTYFEVVLGDLPNPLRVMENDCVYDIVLTDAQKTGWFYDHRFNRERIARYCKDKNVLDVFSYCGAFTIPMAKVAQSVIAIDRSERAIAQLNHNALLNHVRVQTMTSDAVDALQTLVDQHKKFDVIVLDPPALIKRKKDIPAGEKHYQKLNELALRLLNDNGVLLSASCSMHLSAESLLNVLRRAAIAVDTGLSVLEQCHQGPDHPVHPAIAETSYLKGFIVSKT
jgi:23S rRNA (cytosine1962-C5)-methyltransferase